MGILARKGDQEKEFTETAWKLLGKNTNGWEQVSNSVAKNIAEPTKKPDNGTKVDSPTNQTVTNEVVKKADEVITVKDDKKVEVDVKAEFIKVVKENNLTKNQIKDYLDSKELSYKSGDSLDSLIELLYTALNGDIAELNTLFLA
jgi:hypothetical protein